MQKQFNEDIFDKYLTDKIVDEKPVQEPKVQPQQPKQEVVVKEPAQTQVATQQKQTLVEKFLNQVVSYAETSGEHLDQKTKTLAVDIITGANKMVVGNQYKWSEIDIQGCGLISQIKRFAKVGLTMEDKLYVDIRRNSKTNLYDINIKPQYQSLEKLLVKFFFKPIERFKTEIICVGDEVIREEDFNTGLMKITGHNRNNNIDRNKLDNIIGAYKIAYVRDGANLIQMVVEIDRNRIDRAYKASPSREKTVWNMDSVKMVKKTATWEFYNSELIRPFMIFPEDIVNDLSVINESSEMEWNAETKFNNVNQAQENVQVNVATGEVINMEYNE